MCFYMTNVHLSKNYSKNNETFVRMKHRISPTFSLFICVVLSIQHETFGLILPRIAQEFGFRPSTCLFKKPPKKPVTDEDGLLSTEIPPNLKRKVDAKRPSLGHVVPREVKELQKRQRLKQGGSSGPKLRAQGKAREDSINNPSNLKILGGSARGKRLVSPDVFLRPMMGKVREAVYSTFTSFGLYQEGTTTHHLDIFAGSGSVGLESLSRGATSCTFVDFAKSCCDTIHTNLEGCGFNVNDNSEKSLLESRCNRVVCADALVALREPHLVGIPSLEKFQIVTLCPPYEEIVYADLIHAVANSPLVDEDTVILLEYPVELGCFPHVYKREDGGALVGIRNRRYGRTVIAMYIVNPTGRLENAYSRPEEFVSI